ncbi:MAG TPA: F0F1 ATP synthase subunit delta [Candidatus Binatia bacterium]|nr:F0F1 ATP synthase subunit delta [Candidatus Binatia bacterium]
MKVTKQTKREARQLFRLCEVKGFLDEGRIRAAVQKAIQEKPKGYLALLSALERLVRLDREKHTAQVETAVPLPADLQATVKARLEKAYGPTIEVRFAQKPELIGGMRIKVGSDVYDGSVQSELVELEKRF